MWLFLAFLAVPLIEIGLFIQIGGWLGLWPTLLIVVITALLGTALVRQQGALALSQVRGSFENLNDPTEPLAHGAMILFSGALLLTPGFFTDAVGFALLIPAVRTSVFAALKSRIKVQSFSNTRARQPHQNTASGTTIDGVFEEVPPPANQPSGPSGWTKH